jgi:hypothetical protein
MDLATDRDAWVGLLEASAGVISAPDLAFLRDALPNEQAGESAWSDFLHGIFSTPARFDLVVGNGWPIGSMRQAAGPGWAPLPLFLRILTRQAQFIATDATVAAGVVVAHNRLWIADHLWAWSFLPLAMGGDGYWTHCHLDDLCAPLYGHCLAAEPSHRHRIWPTLALRALGNGDLPPAGWIGGPDDWTWMHGYGVDLDTLRGIPAGEDLIATAGIATVRRQGVVAESPCPVWERTVTPHVRDIQRFGEVSRHNGVVRTVTISGDLPPGIRTTAVAVVAGPRPLVAGLSDVVRGLVLDAMARDLAEPDGAWMQCPAVFGLSGADVPTWFRPGTDDLAFPLIPLLVLLTDKRLLPSTRLATEDPRFPPVDGIALLQGGLAAAVVAGGWRCAIQVDAGLEATPDQVVLVWGATPPPAGWAAVAPNAWLAAVADAEPFWSYARPLPSP